MSEIITSANITSFIRSLVDEATAKYWGTTEVALYVKFGIMAVASKYWYLLAPRDAKVAQTSLVASTEYIEMPGSSIASGTLVGSGLDDVTFGGIYGHRADVTYRVTIDGVGTPNTFKWY